jgi:hypothetical protein
MLSADVTLMCFSSCCPVATWLAGQAVCLNKRPLLSLLGSCCHEQSRTLMLENSLCSVLQLRQLPPAARGWQGLHYHTGMAFDSR